MGSVNHRVTYHVASTFQELVELDPRGKILDAGPLLRMFVGRNINEIRQRKMITKIESLSIQAIEDRKPKIKL